MAYMSRDERRAQIMNTAVDIVSRENLAAATARRIAQETGCSLGQIHRHFNSADALRAEAVQEVWAKIEPSLIVAIESLPLRQRLLAMLDCQQVDLPPPLREVFDQAIRLWKEAWDTRQAPEVKSAISRGLQKSQELLRQILSEGVETGAFSKSLNIDDVSIRLLAAYQGYSLLVDIGSIADSDAERTAFIEGVLSKEGI